MDNFVQNVCFCAHVCSDDVCDNVTGAPGIIAKKKMFPHTSFASIVWKSNNCPVKEGVYFVCHIFCNQCLVKCSLKKHFHRIKPGHAFDKILSNA